MLKACIADMRLALEALASEEQDFRTALGNFMFRWERELRAAGVAPAWRIDVPDEVLAVSPHAALQVLRLLQEALTNVLKHAEARHVHVRLVRDGDSRIRLEVEDDGRGLPPAPASATGTGRGLANMQARAQRLNARLDVASVPGRTCVTLVLPPAFA
jgi:signal transduction histidine kinase